MRDAKNSEMKKMLAGTIALLVVVASVGVYQKWFSKTSKFDEDHIGECYYQEIQEEHVATDDLTMYTDNEILLVTEDGVKKRAVEKLAKKYDAEIVGRIEQTGDYQLQLSNVYSLEELEQLSEDLKAEDLAQANVGLAMNSGTTAAKEAANMVDLDSDPTKILEVVEIGKQLLITRGSLTTFSIANDVAKYFAIIPAMFKLAVPELNVLNIMGLATSYSAILSALIFNAIIIPCLIPLAMKGVKYRPMSSGKMLGRNMMIYGLGGIIAPFVGIKIIDLIIAPVLAALGFGM